MSYRLIINGIRSFCILVTISAGLTLGLGAKPPRQDTPPLPDEEGYHFFTIVECPIVLPVSRVKASVVYSLNTSHWKINRLGETEIRARLEHREWIVELKILVAEQRVTMLHQSTAAGRPRVNEAWLKRLAIVIKQRLSAEAKALRAADAGKG